MTDHAGHTIEKRPGGPYCVDCGTPVWSTRNQHTGPTEDDR